MSGYDSIDRYCRRLETRLGNMYEKEQVMNEIRSHMEEAVTELTENGGWPQEKAEQLAIAEMGPVSKLSRDLRKFAKQNFGQRGEDESIWDFYTLKGPISFSTDGMVEKRYASLSWKDFVHPVIAIIYIALAWFMARLPFEITEATENTQAMRTLVFIAFMGVTVFTLFMHSLEHFRPLFSRVNLIIMAVLAAACLILRDLLDIPFFNGTFFILNYTFVPWTAHRTIYIAVKLVISVICLIISIRSLKKSDDGIVYPVLQLFAIVAPSLAMFLSVIIMPYVLPIWFILFLAYTAGAEMFTMLMCNNVVFHRTLLRCLCVVGLAEIVSLYANAALGLM